jgi:hypothetical protein
MTAAPRGPLMLAVAELGTPSRSYWPDVADDKTPAIEAGEVLRGSWKGALQFWSADAKHSLRKVWEPPERANVWVTDRRILYTVDKYDWGANYGKSGIGLAVTTVSRTVAKGRRRGKMAAGQIRFEWPASVLRYESQNPLGFVARFVGLDCGASNALMRTLIRLRKEDTGLPDQIIRDVAARRLATSESLDNDHRSMLERIAVDPTACETETDQKHGTRFWIPGGTNVPDA